MQASLPQIDRIKTRARLFTYLFILFLTGIFFFTPSLWATTVTVDIVHSQDKYAIGGAYPIVLHLKISKPWYIHGPRDEGQGLIPTRLSFKSSESIKIEEVDFPAPEKVKFEYTSEAIEVYSKEAYIKASLVVGQKAATTEHVVTGSLFYQACSSNSCLPPENIPIKIVVPVVLKDTPVTQLNQDAFRSLTKSEPVGEGFLAERLGSGLFLTILAIFLCGLALNLTPCIYPLIPITVSYFGGKSERIHGHTILHGFFYLTGLSITNSLLGVSAALSGRMLGSVLQNPAVLIFIAGVMTIMAFSFFGFWEIRVPQFLSRFASKNYKGYLGTFFMGLTLGILAAPCIGPFILVLLTYVGQKGDPFLGFLYFFILSIGMGLPLLILAIFSGVLDRLPRSGDWMVWVKKVMGWGMVVMAIYIINPLMPNIVIKTALYSIAFILAGTHFGFLDKTGQGLKKFSYTKKVLGIILIILAIINIATLFQKKEGVLWEPYTPGNVVEAVLEGKPVIIDFYADWCIPCKELDKKVFHDREVIELSNQFVRLRLDLTRRHPMQEKVMSMYNVKGVPAVIFLMRNGTEMRGLRVEYFVDKEVFLSRMKKVLDQKP